MSAKENFVERLKLAAQEVIDNAEDIVGEHDMMTEVEVCINISTLQDHLDPEISINRSFYSDRIKQYLFEDWETRSEKRCSTK